MKPKTRKYRYAFDCCVTGVWDGEVEARNKGEAIERAKQELAFENLQPNGDINVIRIRKDKP